ncbi:MAG: hypothetical protein AAF730_11065 [Bacteroidota bacterium]
MNKRLAEADLRPRDAADRARQHLKNAMHLRRSRNGCWHLTVPVDQVIDAEVFDYVYDYAEALLGPYSLTVERRGRFLRFIPEIRYEPLVKLGEALEGDMELAAL